MRICAYDPAYRDDMIFLVLSAKDALGCVPHLNEDLLDVPAHYDRRGGGFWLALDDADRVIGCIGVLVDGACARLHRLYVKPACKRQGIGSRLLACAERYAAQQGAEEAVVHMGDPEHYWESIPFYAAHGYRETAYRWVKKRWGPVALKPLTEQDNDCFFRNLQQDISLFANEAAFSPYQYDAEQARRRFQRHLADPQRVDYSILLDDHVIGQLAIKRIDRAAGTGEMEICLVSDDYKNRGFGTRAEKLAVQAAFDALDLRQLVARCLPRNQRSMRALEKAGFSKSHQDDVFVIYSLNKKNT